MPEPMNNPLINGNTAQTLVKDTTTADFVTDVIKASKQTPVIVDFWAPWCEPCKQLTPTLEKLVTAANGAVQLVKMNIDEHPEIPGQLGVQSIPAVFAFKGGKPAGGFTGLKSESELKQFIEQLTGGKIGPSPVEQSLELAVQAMEQSDIATASQIFMQLLEHEPGHPVAIAGLAKCYLKTGDLEKARATLDQCPPEHHDHAAITGIRAALELAEQAQNTPQDLAPLMAALDANPNDHQTRYDLAIALNAANQRDQAAEHLLSIIASDQNWNDQAARKQLLQFFEAWGPNTDATQTARRQLSSLLFS